MYLAQPNTTDLFLTLIWIVFSLIKATSLQDSLYIIYIYHIFAWIGFIIYHKLYFGCLYAVYVSLGNGLFFTDFLSHIGPHSLITFKSYLFIAPPLMEK